MSAEFVYAECFPCYMSVSHGLFVYLSLVMAYISASPAVIYSMWVIVYMHLHNK